nr:NAD-binding protein [Pleionea sp. CnH1-48]
MLFELLPDKSSGSKKEYDSTSNIDEPEVIIAGFGRFGQIAGRILSANDIPFTALDKDAAHIEFVKRFGNKVFYGDAARLDLLRAAGIEHARLVLVAVNDPSDAEKIVTTINEHYPDVQLVVRARDRNSVLKLRALGADCIVRETFASGLSAARHVLTGIGYSNERAEYKVNVFKHHDQGLLDQQVAHSDDMDKLVEIAKEGRKELSQLFEKDKEL